MRHYLYIISEIIEDIKIFENVYNNVLLHETGTYVFEKLYIKDQVWITYLNMKKIQGNIGRVNML